MNATKKLTRKKVLIPGIAALAALGIGGVALANDGDDDLGGRTRDRAAQAALDHVGEGRVTDAERGDDDDPEAYEVEVTRDDDTEVDVRLDRDLSVLSTDDDRDEARDDRYDDDRDDRDDRDDSDDRDDRDDGDRDRDDRDDRDDRRPDADDRALSPQERERAAAAARAAVPGTVTDVEASDDRVSGGTAAYEVEIIAADGTEWDLWLGNDLTVLAKRQDR